MNIKPFSDRLGNFRIIPIWFVLLILHLWAIFIYRPLWSDGTGWFYEITKHADFFSVKSVTRYSALLFQLPTVMYYKYFSEATIPVAKLIFSFSYGIVNFFWFTLGSLYLHSRKKPELLLVNFFLYLSIIMSAQGFYVNLANQTTSAGIFLFWILLLENKSLWRNIVATIVLLFLLWGYELSLAFMPLYLILLYKRKDYRFLTFAMILIVGISIFRFLQINEDLVEDVQSQYLASLFSHIGGLNLLSYLSLIIFGLSFTELNKVKKVSLIIFAGISICVFALYFKLHYRDIADHYFSARTTMVLKAVIILGTILWASFRNLTLDKKYLSRIMYLTLFVVVAHEVKLNTSWVKALSNVEKYSERGGCRFLHREKEYVHPIEENGVTDWSLPYISIIQRGKREPDTVLFTRRWGLKNYIDPCFANNRSWFPYHGKYKMSVTPGRYIRFSPKIWERQQ